MGHDALLFSMSATGSCICHDTVGHEVSLGTLGKTLPLPPPPPHLLIFLLHTHTYRTCWPSPIPCQVPGYHGKMSSQKRWSPPPPPRTRDSWNTVDHISPQKDHPWTGPDRLQLQHQTLGLGGLAYVPGNRAFNKLLYDILCGYRYPVYSYIYY